MSTDRCGARRTRRSPNTEHLFDAGRITIPLLVIDAGNEELFDRHIAGELAIQRARANGAPAKYTVIPGITHYQVYGDNFEEATQMAVDWFAGCWK